MTTTQDFIEKNYPNYHDSEFVSLWKDNEILFDAIYIGNEGTQLIDLDKIHSSSALELYDDHKNFALANNLYTAEVVSQQHYYLTAIALQRTIEEFIRKENHAAH